MNRAIAFHFLACALLAAVAASGFAAPAAATNLAAAKTGTNGPGTPTTKAATNAAPAEIPIPHSRFVIPKSRGEGVDPFFPLTVRFQPATTASNSTNKSPERAELVIKGFSGTPARPFVIINDKTFGIGENRELTTPQGRVRVRCLEILLNEAAVVEVNGERRELRFRTGQ